MKAVEKKYTKESILNLLHNLDTKAEYRVHTSPGLFCAVFYDRYNRYTIQVDLTLDFDMEMSERLRTQHPKIRCYRIIGFDLGIISTLKTNSPQEVEYFTNQYQDALKILSLFREISKEKAVLVENT